MLDETWAEFHIIADEFRDLGDRVLAIGRTKGRGQGGGVQVDAPIAAIFDLRDAKWWRARGCPITTRLCGRRIFRSSGRVPVVRCEAEVGETPEE